MYKSTIEAMNLIFSNKYNHENPLNTFDNFANRSSFLSFKKGDMIIQQNTPVKYIFFLLKGSASVINNISWVNNEIVDTLVPLDLLGLVEHLNGQPNYTAYVIAEAPCVLMRVPIDTFVSIIKENGLLCYEAMRVLGKVTEHNMNRAETNAIFQPSDRLGHYLYLKAEGHLPYTYPYTRKKLADDLYINLRSLYRHIDIMRESGYLSVERGKIIITKEHFEKLHERYGSIIL